jgi:hypothetical protein
MSNFKMRIVVKKILSKLIPDSAKLRFLSYIPKLESWRRNHKEIYPLFKDRYELYHFVSSEVLRSEPITYLEFGVFKGLSIKQWASINKHSNSTFVGFDTFLGLPENWDSLVLAGRKGDFDTKGEMPCIKDSRVSFIKGLFQESLPVFLTKKITSQLVIHMDADLYSSTLYVLTQCESILVPGTIIIFDEFSSILHEFRALEDFCSSYRRSYVVLGATEAFEQVVIQML